MSRRGWLLFAAMCVIWGVPYLLIKVAVREVTPATLVLVRTGIGALILVPLAVARDELRPVLAAWKPLLAYTTIEIAIPWLLLSSAEKRLTSSLSGLLVAAVPLVSTVLSWTTGGSDHLDRRGIAGLLVGLSGVAALVGFDVSGAEVGAVTAVAIVVLCYATGPLILARYLGNLPSLGVVAGSLALCAIAYAPFGIVQAPGHLPNGRVLASLVVLGVVCTAVGFVGFFHLIGEIGPVRSTVITYINPAVAVALGVAFLGESFTVGTGIGFGLVLAGSVLATRRWDARPVRGLRAAAPVPEP